MSSPSSASTAPGSRRPGVPDLACERGSRGRCRAARARARRAGCRRLVALGTCFEYAPSDEPLAESSPLGPTTPYARAKVTASSASRSVCDGTATTLAWARLFYLYGPDEDPRRLVPAVTLALLEGRPAPTTPGEQLRDFLHVDDVAGALVAVAESDLAGAGERRHGTPRYRARDRRDARHITRAPRPPRGRRAAIRARRPDGRHRGRRRARRECGFTPGRTLEDGLARRSAGGRRRQSG